MTNTAKIKLFLVTLAAMGGTDVNPYHVTLKAFGSSLSALTDGAYALHAARGKGYLDYSKVFERVHLTAAGAAVAA